MQQQNEKKQKRYETVEKKISPFNFTFMLNNTFLQRGKQKQNKKNFRWNAFCSRQQACYG